MDSSAARFLVAVLCSAVLAACGGDGKDEPRGGSVSVADVAKATERMRAARDCPTLHDAGADLAGRMIGAKQRASEEVEAALADADATLVGRRARLGCGNAKEACEELAERIEGVDRGDLC